MLVLFALYIFLLALFQTLGHAVTRVAKLQTGNQLWKILLGLLVAAVAARWYSLWFPLSWPFVVAIASGALACALRWGTGFRALPLRPHALLLVLAGLPLLFLAAQGSISYDEALYHAAFVQWTTDYGTVKGLANLHGRLGFNSSWHVFTAAFNFNWLAGQPLNSINGLLALWGLGYFLEENRLRGSAVSGWMGVLLLFPLLLVYHLIDPSADYAVFVLGLVLLNEVHHWRKREAEERRLLSVVMPLIALFLVTVKLSSIPFLLLAVIVLGARLGAKQWLALVITSGLVVLPWLLANYQLSGYIVYPYLQLPSLNPVWKVPAVQAQEEILGIRWTPFQRWTGADISMLEDMGLFERYQRWFSSIRLVDQALFVGTQALLFGVLFLQRERYRLLAAATALVGFYFALVSAPDFRFIAPFTIFGLAVLLGRLNLVSKPLQLLRAAAICGQMAVALVLYQRLKQTVVNPEENYHFNLSVNPILPDPYPRSAHRTVLLQGHPLYLFDEGQKHFNWNMIPGSYGNNSNHESEMVDRAMMTEIAAPSGLRLLNPKMGFAGGLYRIPSQTPR